MKKIIPLAIGAVVAYMLYNQFFKVDFEGPGTNGGSSIVTPYYDEWGNRAKPPFNIGPGKTVIAYGAEPGSDERRKQRKKGRNVIPVATSVKAKTGIAYITADVVPGFVTRTGGGALDRWVGGR